MGTITEIHDYLRLLYARAGVAHCPECGARIQAQTPQQIVDRVRTMEEGTRFQVLSPVVRGRKGEYQDLIDELRSDGYTRAIIDGEAVRLENAPKLEKKLKHTIEVVIDRLVVREGMRQRITRSPSTRSSRGRSPSTRPTVRARIAPAWASASRSTQSWSSPMRSFPSPRVRSSHGPPTTATT